MRKRGTAGKADSVTFKKNRKKVPGSSCDLDTLVLNINITYRLQK